MMILAGFSWITNAIKSANRYVVGLRATRGRKTCSEIARATNRSHDAVQRDLNTIARHPEFIRDELLKNVIDAEKTTPGGGALIIDGTLLHKPYSRVMEGVSHQHTTGVETVAGIGISSVVWTDLQDKTVAVDLFSWKKGDQSKIITGANFVISLAQKIGVQTVLADAAYATEHTLHAFNDTNVYGAMRFPCNRAVSLSPNEKPIQLKNHPAFKFVKNKRCIVQEVFWKGMRLRVIALKIHNKKKGWITLFLVTNAPFKKALEYARYYKKRWKIEVVNRATKQDFGLGQCQARSLKKQEAHCLGVFLAYNKASAEKPVNSTKKQPKLRLRPMKSQKRPMQRLKNAYKFNSLTGFA